MCCRVLQCEALCCSVKQCVIVCCSVLQCAAVCCSVLQYFLLIVIVYYTAHFVHNNLTFDRLFKVAASLSILGQTEFRVHYSMVVCKTTVEKQRN